MKKILQIVIPTYNRSCQLEKTLNSISKVFLGENEKRLCIDVYDNSDTEIQELNSSFIPEYVKHHKNNKNLGYANNVKKCLNSYSANYIWLISDDDILIVDNIILLLDYLQKLDNRVCGISLNYEVPNPYKKEYDIVSCLKGDDNLNTIKFINCLSSDKLPFDFISGFIIKSEILKRIDIQGIEKENLYMQSMIYCKALMPDDLISFYINPVIKWKGDSSLRWPFKRLYEDRQIIRNILLHQHKFILKNDILIRNLLKWALLSKIGYIKNTNIEKDKYYLFSQVIFKANIFNIFLCILLLIPNIFIKRFLIIGFSTISQTNSSMSFVEKYKNNKKIFN